MPVQPFGFNLNPGVDGFWEDERNPATRTKRGSNDKPDFDFTNLGLLFPQNDDTEKVYVTDQMPHAWLQGSSIKPHVHYIQDESGVPVWKLDYRFYDNGDTVPSYTTISTADGAGAVFTYTSGSILQILPFAAIALPNLGTSGWYDFILYRDDNVVTGDVLMKGFDFHLVKDSWGSYQEYTKV